MGRSETLAYEVEAKEGFIETIEDFLDANPGGREALEEAHGSIDFNNLERLPFGQLDAMAKMAIEIVSLA